MNQVYIGTSGWSYKGWEKAFYPRDLPKTEQFEFYATQFPTVEINLTFYRLPTPNMVRGWRAKAPPGFVYAIKGSRYITHMKKLKNLDHAVDRFFEHIRVLRSEEHTSELQSQSNIVCRPLLAKKKSSMS